MADYFGKVRDALVAIATQHPRRFRHASSGYVNESALARALGVAPSTVHRILHGKRLAAQAGDPRAAPPDDYYPSPRLLEGLRALTGVRDLADVFDFLENAPRATEAELRALIRDYPHGGPGSPR